MLKGFSFAVAIMLAATTSLHSLAAAGDLVELCHHPPGNPDHHVMIVVTVTIFIKCARGMNSDTRRESFGSLTSESPALCRGCGRERRLREHDSR